MHVNVKQSILAVVKHCMQHAFNSLGLYQQTFLYLPLFYVTEDEIVMLGHYDSCPTGLTVHAEDFGVSSSGQKYLVGTRKRTIRDVNFIKDWFNSNGYSPDIETMDESTLNDQLVRFYADARTKDDKQFTRSSLLGLRASLNRYLLSLPPEQKSWHSILKHHAFASSNQIMAQKSTEERQRDKPPKSIPISGNDLKKMLSSDALSTSNPQGLQKKIFLDLLLHFGLRGNKAMWSLSKDSFLLEVDKNGQQYYRLNQDLELPKQEIYSEMKDWYWMSRMYEIPGDPMCPVKGLSQYLSKLSAQGQEFFQRVVDNKFIYGQEDNMPWYRGPMGHQVLMRMMADISIASGLSHTYTNTCVKSTLNSLLAQQGINLEAHFQYRKGQMFPEELQYKSQIIHDAFYNCI